jgi:hypothetical protein
VVKRRAPQKTTISETLSLAALPREICAEIDPKVETWQLVKRPVVIDRANKSDAGGIRPAVEAIVLVGSGSKYLGLCGSEKKSAGGPACHVWQPCNPYSSGEGSPSAVPNTTMTDSSSKSDEILRSTSGHDSLAYKKEAPKKNPPSQGVLNLVALPRTARRYNRSVAGTCKWHR